MKIAHVLNRLRRFASRWIWVGAMFHLIMASSFFFTMWFAAYSKGWLPEEPWGEMGGNHGPWRHLYELRGLWWLVIKFLVLSLGLATLSFILSPRWRSGLLALVVTGLGFAFFRTHNWLVD